VQFVGEGMQFAPLPVFECISRFMRTCCYNQIIPALNPEDYFLVRVEEEAAW
jgi:hypothetical protein